MIKISRELKTGAVAITVIVLFIWGFNYLKGHNLFESTSKFYYTEYNNVQGLNTASVVTINGYNVGKVEEITFNTDPLKKGELVVKFSLSEEFSFSKQSIAKIYSASLMGGKSLAIIPSYEGEMAEKGDYLKGEIESDMFSSVGEKLNPLQAKLENVIVSADSLLVSINNVIDHQSQIHIKDAIAEFSEIMANLNSITKNADSLVVSNKDKLEGTLSNAEHITENLSSISDTLANANLGNLVRKMELMLDNLNNISAGIERGEGTLGKFVKNDSVYNNLNGATKELEELLREVKLHPKRFVHFSMFGKKEEPYKAEEEVEEEIKEEDKK